MQEPRDIDVERRRRRRFDEARQLAVVACGAEPAPVAHEVHVDALAVDRGLANDRGARRRATPESHSGDSAADQARIVHVVRFFADARARAALELARKAGSVDAAAPAAAVSSTTRAPRRACAATSRAPALRRERTVVARQRPDGATSARGTELRQYRRSSTSTPASSLRRSARLCAGSSGLDEHRLAQERAELARGLLELDAANLLRQPQVGLAAPVAAEVRGDALAQIDALADVDRQRVLAEEAIDARRFGQSRRGSRAEAAAAGSECAECAGPPISITSRRDLAIQRLHEAPRRRAHRPAHGGDA